MEETDVTEDSFRSPNLSFSPEETNMKMAAKLPETRVKAGMQPTNQLKIVGRRMPMNRVQSNLRDGDLQKIANAVTVEVN